jgi:branched-chain amino acid transport system substrate-binding protein
MFQKKEGTILFISIAIASFFLAMGIWLLTRLIANSPAEVPSPSPSASSPGNPSLREQPTSIQNKVSVGDKILFSREEGSTENPAFAGAKRRGTNAMSNGDYAQAVTAFEEALQKYQNAPETVIYLNNARIGSDMSYVIAAPVPISGPNPGNASEMLRGIAQAQNEVNEAGGINGIKLKVKIFNDSDDLEISKAIASAIVQDPDVLAVVGHWSSGTSLEAAKIYTSGKIAFVSPVSTTIKLSDFSPYVFRINANTYMGGRALADYALNKLSKKKVAVFFDSTSVYSEELESQFSTDIKLGGGDIVDRIDLSLGLSPADSVNQAIKRGAELLLLVPSATSADKALQVVTINRRRLPLLGDMGNLYRRNTLEVGSEAAVGMVLAPSWHIDGNPDSDFPLKSRTLWKADVNWATAMSYNAAQAVIEALKRQKSPSRSDVQLALTNPNFSANGVSSQFRFLPSGDANTPIQLVEIRAVNRSSSGTGYDFVPVR